MNVILLSWFVKTDIIEKRTVNKDNGEGILPSGTRELFVFVSKMAFPAGNECRIFMSKQARGFWQKDESNKHKTRAKRTEFE